MKKVYVAMCADIIHKGHLNIIEKARSLGEVTIGLLTDEAIASYKSIPIFCFDDRKQILKKLIDVHDVIPQETLDYCPNLRKLKPDYVVHGDDWQIGIQQQVRYDVIECLHEWDGELIEVPYTKNVSSTKIKNFIYDAYKDLKNE